MCGPISLSTSLSVSLSPISDPSIESSSQDPPSPGPGLPNSQIKLYQEFWDLHGLLTVATDPRLVARRYGKAAS